ncbi:MAG: DUF973 family protein [Acidilobus sp.]
MSQPDELEGVRRLRSGVLLLILIPVLILIIGLVGAAVIYAAVMSASVSSYTGSSLVADVTVLAVVLSLISLVLTAIAFGRLRGGFSLLSAAGRGGSTGVTGAWLIIIAAIIALPGAALLMFGGFIVSSITSVIGNAGYMLIGKGLYDIGSSYGKDSLKTGGALVAISFAVFLLTADWRGLLSYAAASGVPALLSLAILLLIFLILGFIGLILSYTTLGDIVRELQAKANQAGAQPATTTL